MPEKKIKNRTIPGVVNPFNDMNKDAWLLESPLTSNKTDTFAG